MECYNEHKHMNNCSYEVVSIEMDVLSHTSIMRRDDKLNEKRRYEDEENLQD